MFLTQNQVHNDNSHISKSTKEAYFWAKSMEFIPLGIN